MARRKKSYGRKAKSIPVLPLLPVVAVAAAAMKYDSAESKINTISKSMIGYDTQNHSFTPASAVPFWGGEVAAIVVHKVANKVGVNSMVRRATFGYLSL